MSSHIATSTRSNQDAADKAAIANYEKVCAVLRADIEAAQAALDQTEDDESEVTAAYKLDEAMVALAKHVARYKRAVHRQAMRQQQAQKAKRWVGSRR
ncbi:MAG: hypothetical protein IPK17_38645 [Chloroflexi bacterium]|uniref:hypothetical protein n=1 Tax=Candidatus Flexifilum breve TaxID=3140694 RepID=UPI003136AF1B|nr:hypothetical protein [Chloroflexota bacterium]